MYDLFLKSKYKPIVDAWDLPKYLDVMDNFFLISRIKYPYVQ